MRGLFPKWEEHECHKDLIGLSPEDPLRWKGVCQVYHGSVDLNSPDPLAKCLILLAPLAAEVCEAVADKAKLLSIKTDRDERLAIMAKWEKARGLKTSPERGSFMSQLEMHYLIMAKMVSQTMVGGKS